MADREGSTSSDFKQDKAWILVQKKTFTNWVNDKLKATEYRVEDLQNDLKDGMVLITLLQVLAPGKKMPGRYKSKPRMDIHKRENLTIAFQFMFNVEKIPLVNIGAMDIYQCNLKLILGLIWTLILRYQIAGPIVHESTDKPKKGKQESKEQKSAVSGKKLLLKWVNIVIRKCKVTNFSSDWNDGLALSALVDYCKPGLIPNHASLDPNNGLENIKNAMDIAEKELGVPQVMHPEDMAVEKPDELSVMTYVSGYSHQDSAGQKSLLIWINEQIPHHQVTNLSSDWTSGVAVGALTDVLSGGQLLEYEGMNADKPVENCRVVMEKAKVLLEIELLVTPEEFASDTLNQLTRVSYLAKFQSCKRKRLTDNIKVSGRGITGDIVHQETGFTVSAERMPKWAVVNAKVTTAAGKGLQVGKYTETGSNAVNFSYTPEEAGEYVVEISMNDSSLLYQPKHIEPTLASKCRASGDGLKRACVGKRAEFTVNYEQAGVGELQVSVQGPSKELPVTIDQTKPQYFNVTYVPEEVDAHEIKVTWGSEQIPDSPFQCDVIDPSKCSASGPGLTQACVDKRATFSVNTCNGGPGELSIKCKGPIEEVPVEINKVQNEYACSYIPKETGEHEVDIRWSDYPVPSSPFRVDSIVPTYTSKCTASGEGLKRACVGKRAEFTVDCEQGGLGELQVLVQGPSKELSVTIDQTKPQYFNVSYAPEEVDAHEIKVTWGSEQIPDSPFQCAVIDPSKCSASGPAMSQAHINVPHTFSVDASNAGSGELSVKCKGSSGDVPVEVRDLPNSIFECTWIPRETGEHVIDIYWSDHPIADSPLRVNAIDASKCTASGDGLKRACVGKRAEFTVNCEQGGLGELQVLVQGPSKELPVTIDQTKPQCFSLSYIPEEVGTHEIKVTWGNEQIPDSPFQCDVIDPSKCSASGPGLTQAYVQRSATFSVNASNGGPGELSVKCEGPIEEVPVEINKVQNEYACSYIPKETGEHEVDIRWSDYPIPSSPFRVDSIVPTYTSKCTASGDGLKRVYVGKRAEFTVDCEQGGVGELQVSVQGPSKELPVTIDQTKPRYFNVSYAPEEVGVHEIKVTWGCEQIPDSPFQCAVIDPSKCSASGPELTQAHINVPHTFSVDTSSAGSGELSVKCKGPSGDVPVEVKELPNSIFECTWIPRETGEHVIDIYWSDHPIADSPLRVNAIDASKCTASGDGLKRACVGKRAEFTVDCEEGGLGELQVFVRGPSKELPVTIDQTKPQYFSLSYIPEEIGAHEIKVTWGSEQIPDSPFQCDVIDPSKCSASGPGLTQAYIDKRATFSVNTCNGGPGELSIKCKGPIEEVPVEINKVQNEYACSYIPKETGEHEVDIRWSDYPIPSSPFRVDSIVPTYTSKCTASGDGLKRACVGKRAEFTVDCEQGGLGELQVLVQGPSKELPVTIDQTKPQYFNVSYAPEEVGTHEIKVTWGSEQIPDSPFQCAVIDPSKCSASGPAMSQAHINVPHTFSVDASSAGSGELSVKCKGPSGDVPVEVKDLPNSIFECTWIPRETGEHVIDIYWSDHPIADSPLRVNAIDASKCTASGDGLKRACVGKRAEFTVDCEEGGLGELQVLVQGPSKELPVTIEKETKPQIFKAFYIPEEVGTHEIKITWGSEQIPDSPFQCAVIYPSQCSASGPGLAQAHVRKAATFSLNATNAGPGELSVKCKGPSGDVPVEVKDLQNSTFNCTWIPRETGEHVIDIYWSDHPIADSPLRVNAIDASKCTASGDGLKRACVGKRAEFTVDCEEGGLGELQVLVQGPSKGLPVTIDQTKPQYFNISYISEEVGAHKIKVTWGCEQIPDSPFQCVVIDPSKCSASGPGLTKAHVSVPQKFSVDANNAGPGELSVKCKGPSGDVPVEVIKAQNEFSCTYIPTVMSEHVVDIFWCDYPIPASPFRVNTTDYADSEKCSIFDLPQGLLHINKQYTFKVDSAQPGYDCDLSVIPKTDKDLANCEIDEEHSSGICTVRFTPVRTGNLVMDVRCHGTSISSSPVSFNVIDPSKPVLEMCDFQVMKNVEEAINIPEDLVDAIPSENEDQKTDKTDSLVIGIGEPLTLVIDLDSEQMHKNITATVTGKQSAPVVLPVVKNLNNSITVYFSPTKPDDYSINLKANGQPLSTGPFNVTYILPKTPLETQTVTWKPKEESVERVSFKYERKMVNAEVSLTIDSSQGEASNTSINIQEASTARPIASSLSELADGKYNLEFVTTDEREYVIAFTYLLKITPSAQNKACIIGSPVMLTPIS